MRSPIGFSLALALLIGILLRWIPLPERPGVEADENQYKDYVEAITSKGVLNLPTISGAYIERQLANEWVLIPPTRLTFLVPAALLGRIGVPPLDALRYLSALAGTLLLVAASILWMRHARGYATAATFLLAVAPLQIHLAHRCLIDNVVAVVALLGFWSAWEILRNPKGSPLWKWLYGAALFLMPLTKENLAFVFVALAGIVLFARQLRLGNPPRSALWITFTAPVAGLTVLALACGGFESLFTLVLLNGNRTYRTPYAIMAGDGAWHRYLVDLVLLNPVLMLFAVGALFRGWREPFCRAVILFVCASYALMAQLKCGINLRYAAIWDVFLCFLAVWQANDLLEFFRKPILRVAAVVLLCGSSLWQFYQVFLRAKVYDPTTLALIVAEKMHNPQPGRAGREGAGAGAGPK